MNVKIFKAPRIITVLILLTIGFIVPGHAQERSEDRILTIRKDTLKVRITEFGLTSLSYKNLSGDTSVIHSISKNDIKTVFFGNGDVEHFTEKDYKGYASTQTQYYKAVRKTPFQREIAEWPAALLIEKKNLYKQKYVPQKAGGITAIAVGGGLTIIGFTYLLASLFALEDDAKGAVPFISGITLATGVGIPLTIFGVKNKRKHRAIEAELYRRGL